MAAIIIKSDNAKNLRLLADLAQRLGDQATAINAEALEDLMLGELMNRQKTGTKADKQKVVKMLGL
jgi:hypothetical protein